MSVKLRCKGCGEVNSIEGLVEVEEEKEHHSHYICPSCEGKKFMKV